MRIAIVGSGIAGLTAAHHLHRDHHITVFEADGHAGGHSHTVDVPVDDRRLAVDTGFIVFNERNYPHFTALLKELGVATQPGEMSFSMRCDRSGLEYNGSTLNTLFAQRSNLLRASFYRMLRDILNLNSQADALVAAPGNLSLGQFLAERGFSGGVVDDYLLPMAGAIWSADPQTILDFPARQFGRFFHNHGLLSVGNRPQWRTVTGGSREYVRALIRPFRDQVRLNTPVEWVRRLPDQVMVKTSRDMAQGYDAVVFACHSDQALALLKDPDSLEQDILGAIPFQRNDVVLHTDASLLPRRRLAHASWNYHRLLAGQPARPAAATVTYNLTRLQNLPTRQPILVTLNSEAFVDPARVIRRMSYTHPVFNFRSIAAQSRWAEINGRNRSHYCGAWWGYGFHEDGVRSGLAVARAINGQEIDAELHLRRVG